MTKSLTILVAFTFTAAFSLAQTSIYVGKVLMNQHLQEIRFKNDSLAFFQPFGGDQKIWIKNDTLIIETANPIPLNQVFINKFKIVYLGADSIFLTSLPLTKSRIVDTLKFINTGFLVEPIKTFNSLLFDILGTSSLGQFGSKRIYLTNDRQIKVGVTDGEPVMFQNSYSTYKTYRLSEREFTNIVDTLAQLLIFKFENDKGGCGFDGPIIRWVLDANGKVIKGTGCPINGTHAALIHFIRYLDDNKMVVRK